ncbi:MAG TPA: phosphohistidine phosphatase [Bacteroidetes bacterium]|nr:phosphohistidine phosphatase [Bacteroidota bacterium]
MKTLLLIRHAKSAHDNPNQPDIERTLNKRGMEDAPFMGKILKQQGIIPDMIYSSPAVRAFTTAKLFAKELDYNADSILIDPVLYSFNASQILSFITGLKNELQTVLLFSHNPTFHELANYFTGNKIPSMPTCCIVGINFETDSWDEIDVSRKQMLLYEFPKKYKGDE